MFEIKIWFRIISPLFEKLSAQRSQKYWKHYLIEKLCEQSIAMQNRYENWSFRRLLSWIVLKQQNRGIIGLRTLSEKCWNFLCEVHYDLLNGIDDRVWHGNQTDNVNVNRVTLPPFSRVLKMIIERAIFREQDWSNIDRSFSVRKDETSVDKMWKIFVRRNMLRKRMTYRQTPYTYSIYLWGG